MPRPRALEVVSLGYEGKFVLMDRAGLPGGRFSFPLARDELRRVPLLIRLTLLRKLVVASERADMALDGMMNE